MIILFNKELTKKNFDAIFSFIFEKFNITTTVKMLDSLKLGGLTFSTKAGLSLSVTDLKSLKRKKRSKNLLNRIKILQYKDSHFNENNSDKINKVWNRTNNLLKKYILNYLTKSDPYNQTIIVLQSGARGSLEQIHQLIGLRSLMVDHTGALVPYPIKKSFMDGLSVFDYLLSSFGARKGIIDTALKTADSGYLTRRLIEAAYEIKILTVYCNTITKYCYKNKFIKHQENLLDKYSVFNCALSPNLCQKCFGYDLAKRNIVTLGETVGILCAQSISEPSTQLTMRTFHTGGVFSGTDDIIDISNISGFYFFDKKQKEVNILDWKNNKEKIKVKTINLSEKGFINKNNLNNLRITINNQLPVFVGYLYKQFDILKLSKNKKGVLVETYKEKINTNDSFNQELYELHPYFSKQIKNTYINYILANIVYCNSLCFKNLLKFNTKTNTIYIKLCSLTSY